jgi:hypothetical protein
MVSIEPRERDDCASSAKTWWHITITDDSRPLRGQNPTREINPSQTPPV